MARRGRLLDWWTRNRPVGAEHATNPGLRTQERAATGALVEKLAGIDRHYLALCNAAHRARDSGIQGHVLSQAKTNPSTVRTAPRARAPVTKALGTDRTQTAPGAHAAAARRRQNSTPTPPTRQMAAAATSTGR